jgi:hypothetical protein
VKTHIYWHLKNVEGAPHPEAHPVFDDTGRQIGWLMPQLPGATIEEGQKRISRNTTRHTGVVKCEAEI